jgi:hypothetical protein
MPVQSGLRTRWVIMALPLLVACRSGGTANQPATLAPRGVLELRVLAAKSGDEAEKFDGYRAVLAKDGPVPLGGEEAYGWFPIKYPGEFFKAKDVKRDFGAIQQGSPMVVAQRGDEFFVLARIGTDCGLTHAKGAPAWCIQTARVNRSTHGYVGVEVELDARGVAQVGKLMEAHAGKEMCIFLDGRAVVHTTLKPGVPQSIRLTGPFSLSEAENMVKLLMETKGAPAS